MPNWESRLTALSLGGQAVAYLLGIVVARHLGVEGFEAYVVASATFILMVTFVPQGLEKYSLRLLPPLAERGEWMSVRRYIGFAGRRLLLASALTGGLVALWPLFAADLSREARIAILVSCASLPAGALVHLLLEVLTALGRPFTATLIFRLVVPGLVLIFVAMTLWRLPDMPAYWAIGAWGLSWCFALGAMLWQLARALPVAAVAPAAAGAAAKAERATWVAKARPFWFYRVSLAVLAQSAVMALEWLQTSASAVGAFAAAAATASLAQVLATSTNRVYASRLSVLLERRDFAGIWRERSERLRWLGLPLLACLALALLFAEPLVALFRPEFAAEGANALRVLAVATAISTWYSIAPTYLKHRGGSRTLYRLVGAGAVLQLGLLVLLVPRLGALGAALATLLATLFIYGNFARLARRELSELRAP